MIYFFYGKDDFLVVSETQQIISSYKKTHVVKEVDCLDADSTITARSLIAEIGTRDLFASRRCIHIKNIFAGLTADAQGDMCDFLTDWSDDNVVLLFSEGSVPRKNSRLFKELNKKSETSKEIIQPQDAQLVKWIESYIQKEGSAIEASAAREIAQGHAIGETMAFVARDCEKLVAYTGEDRITTEDVHALTRHSPVADIFQLIEMATAGNQARALHLLRTQIMAGDDPHYIFSMYVYHVRTLLGIAGLYYEGVRDKSVIARTVGAHPFVVQKAMGSLDRIDQKKLTRAFTFLRTSDAEIKVGKADIQLVLERFIWLF